MARYEYKVVPAPRKGVKAKGIKTSEDRFAHALALLINAEARNGWDYQRTDTLPMQERKGFTGSVTTYQNMLVFRRPLSSAEASLTPADTTRRVPQTPTVTSEPAPERTARLSTDQPTGTAPALGSARGSTLGSAFRATPTATPAAEGSDPDTAAVDPVSPDSADDTPQRPV